jgi:RNA polymerase sigma-70 factor (ECF subfamily)
MESTEADAVAKGVVQKVLEGDPRAFSHLIHLTERLVAYIIKPMIPETEDQKDLVQDIYSKVYTGLPYFRFDSKLTSWVGRIAYHQALNFCEQRGRKTVFPLEETASKHWSSGANTSSNEALRTLHQEDQQKMLDHAFQSLPPIYQTLIHLYHQEEMGYEEIAAMLELPLGTVKNYLYRARQNMKTHLITRYKNEWP